MKNTIHIRKQVMILLFIIIVIYGLISVYYQYNIVKHNFDRSVEKLKIDNYSSFKRDIEDIKTNISIQVDTLLENPQVINAFKKKDRSALLNATQKFFERISLYDNHISIMTFRLLDGSAFLRLHKPKLFGDPIKSNRRIILDAIKEQKRLFGFEKGKLKMTYRVVTPIFESEKFLGVLEVGIEPEHIIENITQYTKAKVALFIKDPDTEAFSFAYGDELIKKSQNSIDYTRQTRLASSNGDDSIFDPNFNLFDHQQSLAAKLVLAYNIDTFTDEVHELIFYIIVTVTLLMIILYLLLNYVIGIFINKFQLLNRQLVDQAKELQKINTTLEDRVKDEVKKNREKDKVLLTQSRMAQMGEMISMIAHQWRQPLTSISAIATRMRMELILTKESFFAQDTIEEAFVKIEQLVHNLSSTIEDFRNFYKPNKEAKISRLQAPIDKALNIIKESLESKAITIIKEYQSHKELSLHINELMQVIISVIANAKDSLIHHAIKDPKITITTEDLDDAVVIKICDNGMGIPEEILPHIFDPYFSTKDEKNGTGLGLYMSKTIIEQHHEGKISAINTQEGACIIIKFKTD